MSAKISSVRARPRSLAAKRRNLLKIGDLRALGGEIRWAPLKKTNPNEPIEVKVSSINEINHDF